MLMRLWVIPYAVVACVCTLVLAVILLLGFILLGFPCWIITGSASSWLEWGADSSGSSGSKGVFIPCVWDVSDYILDIKMRQRKLNNKNKETRL